MLLHVCVLCENVEKNFQRSFERLNWICEHLLFRTHSIYTYSFSFCSHTWSIPVYVFHAGDFDVCYLLELDTLHEWYSNKDIQCMQTCCFLLSKILTQKPTLYAETTKNVIVLNVWRQKRTKINKRKSWEWIMCAHIKRWQCHGLGLLHRQKKKRNEQQIR